MRAIDADKLYFAQRYARVDPDSDRLTPVLAVDKYQIENAPTLDVEPVVHAKWHDVYLVEPWIATGICSHCDTKSYVNPGYPFALRCPNCGAHMKDGE